MQIPTEQKIGMSLEDLIKSKQHVNEEKRKKNNKNAGNDKIKKPAAPVNTKPNAATAKPNNRRSTRVAANQAKPLANSKPAVQAAKVAKAVAATKAKRSANINERRGLPAAPAPPATGGLKISFKPAELNKTTDRAVSQQIKAVLSRQSSGRTSTPRSTSNNSNNTANNKRPQVRGKTLRVQH